MEPLIYRILPGVIQGVGILVHQSEHIYNKDFQILQEVLKVV